MIGGSDITIPTDAGPAALDLAVRATMRYWPSAVFEDAQTGRMFGDYRSIRLCDTRELLIYKNEPVADRWHHLGADQSLGGTLIHLLLLPNELTVVVDSDPAPEMKSLLSAVQRALGQDIFRVVAFRKEAA